MSEKTAPTGIPGPLLSLRVVHRDPFRYLTFPLISRLQQAAMRQRRRAARRLIGKPARWLFRMAHRGGLGGTGRFALDVGGKEHPFEFNARNTQFTPTGGHSYEPELAVLLDLLLGPNDTFFDIGANWGYFPLYVLSRPDFNGSVHAFEAYPPTFTDLNSMARQSPFGERFVCHAVALSDRNGPVSMGMIDGLQSGTARLDGADGLMTVEGRRLDDMDLPSPSLIKIDVEGHEASVLSGASRILETARPIVVFENWLEATQPATTLQPISLLEHADYRFFVPAWIHDWDKTPRAVTATNAEPTDRLGLIEIGWQHRFLLASQINILAYPAERLTELIERFRT